MLIRGSNSVIFILVIVARSKLVLDFACTIHLIHLITTSLYSHSIPYYWFWWALQATSTTLMTVLGVWACQWRELKPISFGGGSSRTAEAPNGVESGPAEEEEAGFTRGRGRGRGRDGAGEYEMVGMSQREE
jgi:protein SYS1